MPGWQQTHRFTGVGVIPGGTDIIGGAPVYISTTGYGVLPCAYASQPVMGIARASAQVGFAVTVNDMPDIKIATNGLTSTISAGEMIGVASFTTVTGASGNVISPIIGKIAGTAKKTVWAIGEALETGQPGGQFNYILKPRLLSGVE